MNKERKKNLFVGIDLGGKTKATTGLCILQESEGKLYLFQEYCKVCHDLRYKEILRTLKPFLEKASVIAIDGPLTLGKGKGLMRLYEKFLSTKPFRKERVTPLPPALMPSLVEIGVELGAKLKESDFLLDRNLIETFPTIIKKMCPETFSAGLLGKKKIPCKSSNQKAAFICAGVAYLHSLGETRYLGYKDGFLFLPAMSFWKKEWLQKFYQAWTDRNRLKYRYLRTNIFERSKK